MATAAAIITDMMDYNKAWNVIIHNFGLLDVAVIKFTRNYSTGRDLIVSNMKQIMTVTLFRKIYHNQPSTGNSIARGDLLSMERSKIPLSYKNYLQLDFSRGVSLLHETSLLHYLDISYQKIRRP